MIRGMHGMFYTSQPEALRAFFRDKLGFFVGWLRFRLRCLGQPSFRRPGSSGFRLRRSHRRERRNPHHSRKDDDSQGGR